MALAGEESLNDGQAGVDSERPNERPDATRPCPARNRVALIKGLDRLRDGLLQKLEKIEALAAEQTDQLRQDSSEREQALRERLFVLEASQARLQAEARRREQDWQVMMQQLEADRRLITEAWDRLEQQRIELAPDHSSPRPPGSRRRPRKPVVPASRQAEVDPASDLVTRSILEQFQALRNDVRRNARGRSGR